MNKTAAKKTTAKKTAAKKTARRRRWTRRGLWAAKWSAVAAIWGAIVVASIVGWFAWDLPSIDHLAAETRRPHISIEAADGTLLAAYGDLHGDRIDAANLPPHAVAALTSIEDRRFFRHFGLDPLGLARAARANLRAGRIVQGGSTLTQQLAKNLFLTRERTFSRKIREAILAVRLELRFTKLEILTIYLNRAYYGAGAYGIEAAGLRYFGRHAIDLTVYQSALLAGVLRAPSRLNPLASSDAAHARALTVLAAMVDTGALSEAQRDAAARAGAAILAGSAETVAGRRYFTDWVLDRVNGLIGVHEGDIIVETSFDPRLQEAAGAALAAGLAQGRGRGATQGAFIAMSPDGAVRAMIGGADYATSQFNRATQARRQPGSAFKPIVYLAALEAGLTPASPIDDTPIDIDGWAPRNYSGRFSGRVTLREALARSLNAATVRVAVGLGFDRVLATARRLGIASDLDPHPSLALGAGGVTLIELTGAYAVLANGGFAVAPHGIVRLRRRDGALIFARGGGAAGPAGTAGGVTNETGRIVDAAHVAMMHDMLGAVVAWGTGRGAALARPAAGKTGTTQRSRDAWFIGYTGGGAATGLVAGVWLGDDRNRPMQGITGGGLPATVWRGFMERALAGVPPAPLIDLRTDLARTP